MKMEMQTLIVIFAACGFLLQFAVVMVSIGNSRQAILERVSQNDSAIREVMRLQELRFIEMIAQTRRDIDVAVEGLRRDLGEPFHAIRSKMTEFEIWSRDNFVRRSSFFPMMESFRIDLRERVDLHDSLARVLAAVEKLDEDVEKKKPGA